MNAWRTGPITDESDRVWGNAESRATPYTRRMTKSESPPSSFRLPPWPQSIVVWLATGFGIGLRVPAPGTAGAAIGSLLAWSISYLPGVAWQLLMIVALNLAGIPLCTRAGLALGGKKDNQAIIWDEIASVPIVFLLTPIAGWAVVFLGFALHRLFDITKPPPARQLERLPGGLGVMADDWIAAVFACLTLWACASFEQSLGLSFLSGSNG